MPTKSILLSQQSGSGEIYDSFFRGTKLQLNVPFLGTSSFSEKGSGGKEFDLGTPEGFSIYWKGFEFGGVHEAVNLGVGYRYRSLDKIESGAYSSSLVGLFTTRNHLWMSASSLDPFIELSLGIAKFSTTRESGYGLSLAGGGGISYWVSERFSFDVTAQGLFSSAEGIELQERYTYLQSGWEFGVFFGIGFAF